MKEGRRFARIRRLPLSRISAGCPQSSTAAATRASFNASALERPLAAPGPNKKTPELSLRGCRFQRIGLRSEVTGDAETASKTVAVASPGAGHEDRAADTAGVVNSAEESARRRLRRALIHQLEVEVEVGDRVPAEIRANDPAKRAGREWALRGLTNQAARHPDVAAAAHVAPLDAADRAFQIGIDGRRPVVLEKRRDGPCSWRGPLVIDRVEERVSEKHRLAVAVGLAGLAPHPIKEAGVPDRALGIDAGHDQVVASAEHPAPALQVDLHARVNGPADLLLRPVADNRKCQGAAGRASDTAIEIGAGRAVGDDVDVVDHARELSLAPALLDM